MEVLLLEDIKGLGRKMEIKSVKPGYAANFLIPRKLAVPADKTVLKQNQELQPEIHIQNNL